MYGSLAEDGSLWKAIYPDTVLPIFNDKGKARNKISWKERTKERLMSYVNKKDYN